jgi:hypothetical protein
MLEWGRVINRKLGKILGVHVDWPVLQIIKGHRWRPVGGAGRVVVQDGPLIGRERKPGYIRQMLRTLSAPQVHGEE